jgi:nucleoside-diphosphate-sugar epimerase
MEKSCILITGANGEIGHGLIRYLSNEGLHKVVALDRSPIDDYQKSVDFYKGDILDKNLLDELNRKYTFSVIFHLAAILSTGGEKEPLPAHRINVEGSLNILNLADEQSNRTKNPVIVVFPSTIAVYGFSSIEERRKAGKIDEHSTLEPTTMYGINKLYIEHLGRYYATRFRLFEDNPNQTRLDFRCVRLPGIMSSESLPSGGTSDYGPEMIHAAAQGKPYECFVTPETKLPFIVMPDAVHSLVSISRASRRSLTRPVYNVASFSITAEEIRAEVLKNFPGADITFKPNPKRLAIVNSWPLDLDDSAARKDWNWRPEFDRESSFKNYLIPGITRRYASQRGGRGPIVATSAGS